jgi:hypothetical protein
MPGRLIRSIVLSSLVAGAALPAATASAAGGGSNGCVTSSGADGSYGASRADPGSQHVRIGVVCSWTAIDAASYFVVGSLLFGASFDVSRLVAGTNGQLLRIDGDTTESAAWYVQCPGTDGELRWVPTTVTVGDVIDAAASAASDRIERPVALIDPDPSAGGVVNLGMWLAVEERRADPVHAQAGPYSADVTPVLESTTFDFGNGDTVTCDGAGTPITDPSDPGQGPCGYTYTQASPRGGYTVTITTTWAVHYVSTQGSGTLDPITRSTTFAYTVDEVHTVGRAG